jgi:hypothetical protein
MYFLGCMLEYVDELPLKCTHCNIGGGEVKSIDSDLTFFTNLKYGLHQ